MAELVRAIFAAKQKIDPFLVIPDPFPSIGRSIEEVRGKVPG